MSKVFKVLAITFLIITACIAVLIARGYYKMKTFRDTHDLQKQISLKCNNYIKEKKSVGLAIAVIQGDKIYIDEFGQTDLDNHRVVDSNTVFEIGSITKVFTADLAQILSDKGVLKWNETIYDILPTDSKPLTDDHTTLLSLATHTSGFPKTPPILKESLKNGCNPYSDMDRSLYTSCIKSLTEKKKPDSTTYEYSNMGFSILANCIETKAGLSYDSLLHQEILNVLGMKSTTLSPTDTFNFATGYDKNGNKTCHWDFTSFYCGCGGMRSNILDMSKFLKANLIAGPLYKSLSETQKQVYGYKLDGIGKGWHMDKVISTMYGLHENIIWKNGGTGGFRSYIGLIPGKKVGIVILSNQANETLTAFGHDLLALASRISMK